jgi:TPR repeat protein
MRPLIVLAASCSCALLVSCNASQGKTGAGFDHAADRLPFVRPLLPVLESLPEGPTLSPSARDALALRRAFFTGDFAVVDQVVGAAHKRYVEGQAENDAERFVDGLEPSQLAGIDVCEDWVAAMPQSYVAHWVCGAIWHNGAWVARGGDYANKVSPVRFALMRERLARSSRLLEKAITLTPKPIEALTLLASNCAALGEQQAAQELFAQAEAVMPADYTLHSTKINFLLPEWGGSAEEVRAAVEHAEALGVKGDALLALRDDFIVRPSKMSDPGAEKAYWERAIAEHPSFRRCYSLLQYYRRVENWRDSIPLATTLIEKYPEYAEAYEMRGEANKRLGNTPAAWDDYRTAAALGDNYAIQTLIQACLQGGLGSPARNWIPLDHICRYGAVLGSAAAANCMASIYREGSAIGGPFHNDIPQSFAWHLVAARAGYHNSQYDLGWLLLSGRAPNVGAEQAQSNGLFWLRRAAEQGHQFAKRKLEEGHYPESEVVETAADSARDWIDLGRDLVRVVLSL